MVALTFRQTGKSRRRYVARQHREVELFAGLGTADGVATVMTYRPVIAKRPDAEMQRFQRQLPRIERRSGHRFARRPGRIAVGWLPSTSGCGAMPRWLTAPTCWTSRPGLA